MVRLNDPTCRRRLNAPWLRSSDRLSQRGKAPVFTFGPGSPATARHLDWSGWLGFNTSHGLGIFTFGLLYLLIATYDFILVERIDAIRPLTIALTAAYIGLSLHFWFYGPRIIAANKECLTVAAMLACGAPDPPGRSRHPVDAGRRPRAARR